jgi:hypothetical protein
MFKTAAYDRANRYHPRNRNLLRCSPEKPAAMPVTACISDFTGDSSEPILPDLTS